MENPLRQYIYEIGSVLGKLGYELCRQTHNPNRPLNIHGEVLRALNGVVFNLHNLSADLDAWLKDMLAKNGKIELPNVFEGTDGVDVETTAIAVRHLLHAPFHDVDSGANLTLTEELLKLEWLFEKLQNTPDPIRYSNASYEDFNFYKITGNR